MHHDKYTIEEMRLSLPLFTLPNGGPGTEMGKITLSHEPPRGTGYLIVKIDITGPPARTLTCSVGELALLTAIDTIRKA